MLQRSNQHRFRSRMRVAHEVGKRTRRRAWCLWVRRMSFLAVRPLPCDRPPHGYNSHMTCPRAWMLIAVALLVCTGCASTHAGLATKSPARTAPQPAPAAEAPYIEVAEVGRSVEGRPLVLHTFGRGTCDLFVLGGIHGNEPGSAVVCEELVNYLRTNPAALMGRSVAVLPAANPDGLTRRLRTNKNLVDLNRNFPASNWKKTRKGGFYGGAVAASEPETLALLEVLERLRPRAIVSVHAMAQPCN